MSALPPKADMDQSGCNVRFVPKADIVRCGEIHRYSITSSARPSSVIGLRRRMPRDELPALRRFCPGVEEYEPQAARLAVDLRLDRGATCDERGVAREAHLAIAADRALVLRLFRPEGSKPRSLGIDEP